MNNLMSNRMYLDKSKFNLYIIALLNLMMLGFTALDLSGFKTQKLHVIPKPDDGCNFNVQYRNITSNSKDLLMTTMFGKPSGHLFCIRTLRHTGSQCSVVVITNKNAIKLLSKKDKKILETLGVEFYITNLDEPSDLELFWSFRKQIAYEFLQKRKNLYRRVVSIDFYDTFFQNDPFCEDLPFNSLMLSVEEHELRQNNRAPSFLKIWPESKFHFMNQPSLNGGTFGGGVEEVFRFHELYMRELNFSYLNCKTDDQTYLDYFVYSGLLEREEIPLVFDKKGVLSSMYNFNSFAKDHRLGFVKLTSDGSYLRACHLWKLLPDKYLKYALTRCIKGT